LIYKDKKNDLLQFDDLNFTLDTASSGIQSSLPMAMVLNFKSEKNFKHFFIIEEPELNLYPTTQKRLVNYLAEKTINKGHELIVTTHSPYILTSFANLIQAGNVAKEKPHLKAELENIVPSQYWLDFDKVGVYYFENGTCRDLLDYENKTIDATAIDDVSEIISKEFDQILDLKYRA
jgi:AAA15 family ATPase/GTPase